MRIAINPKYQGWEAEIGDAIKNFAQSGVEMARDRNTIKVFELDSMSVAIKQFKRPNWINRFVYNGLRPGKAARSYRYAQRLLQLGILTPEPIAYFENRRTGGLQDSYYISKKVNCDLTFRALIHEPNYPDRAEMLRQFAAFTYELHEKAVHFLDHSPGNTLIVKEAINYAFYLVDLNRMRFEKMSWTARMQNFAKLALTPDMIEVIGATYADLSGESVGETTAQIAAFSRRAAAQRARKKTLKKWLGV